MADGCVFLCRVLQQIDFPGGFFGQHRETKFPDHLDLSIGAPLGVLGRFQVLNAQGLVDLLYAPVLQHGNRRARHVDPDGPQEQKQGDTVQPAHRHIAAPGHVRVVVELPGPAGGIGFFEVIPLGHFCLKVLCFLFVFLLFVLIPAHT